LSVEALASKVNVVRKDGLAYRDSMEYLETVEKKECRVCPVKKDHEAPLVLKDQRV